MAVKSNKNARTVLPSSNEKLDKIINYLMKDGKKSVAKKIYSDMLKEIKSSGHMNPQIVVETAIENASPQMMIKSKRLGGSVYQVPVEVKQNKRLFYAMKWILDAVRAKSGKPMYKKLSEEILAAYANQWAAVKKKEETHKMAEANKAFAYMAKYVN